MEIACYSYFGYATVHTDEDDDDDDDDDVVVVVVVVVVMEQKYIQHNRSIEVLPVSIVFSTVQFSSVQSLCSGDHSG